MTTPSPNSYRTNLPPADQEKARMLALDLLDPNKYVNEQQICYVARAFLELSTSSNGPNCLPGKPSQEYLLEGAKYAAQTIAPATSIAEFYWELVMADILRQMRPAVQLRDISDYDPDWQTRVDSHDATKEQP